KPSLADDCEKQIHSALNILKTPNGLQPVLANEPAEVVFKVQAANVLTSQSLKAEFTRQSLDDEASIAVSSNNGLTWKDVWTASNIGDVPAEVKLMKDVNGAYEVLIKVKLKAKVSPAHARLRAL